MEQLATGLWGLVGKAAGGVGTLAKKVEAATKEVASEVAVEFKDTLQVLTPSSPGDRFCPVSCPSSPFDALFRGAACHCVVLYPRRMSGASMQSSWRPAALQQ